MPAPVIPNGNFTSWSGGVPTIWAAVNTLAAHRVVSQVGTGQGHGGGGSGVCNLWADASGSPYIHQVITGLVVGQPYIITLVVSYFGSGHLIIGDNLYGQFGGSYFSDGTQTITFTATNTSADLLVQVSASSDVTVDSLVLSEGPLAVTSFSPTTGPTGTSVVLTGTSFDGATAVTFNGTPPSGTPTANFTVNSSVQLTAIVPPGATSGTISVMTQSGTVTSSQVFVYTPYYGPVLKQHLPRGPIWDAPAGGSFDGLLQGLAEIVDAWKADADSLLTELNPVTAVNMLPEWEAAYGLPGSNPSPPTTTAARQQAVAAKVLGYGTITPAFVLAMIAKLGYAGATIQQGYFQICYCNATGTLSNSPPSGCTSVLYTDQWAFGWNITYTPISTAQDALMQWLVNQVCPVHTQVFFNNAMF